MTYPTATTTIPGPITDSAFLALIHTAAAGVADVDACGWVGKGHAEIRITVPNTDEQERVTGHLFDSLSPVGHWHVNHIGVRDEDCRRIGVTVAVGGAR